MVAINISADTPQELWQLMNEITGNAPKGSSAPEKPQKPTKKQVKETDQPKAEKPVPPEPATPVAQVAPTPEPVKQEPAEPPEAEKPVQPETATEPEASAPAPAPAPDTEALRQACKDTARVASLNGRKADVKEILRSYGVSMISAIPADRLPEALERFKALGGDPE